MSQKRRQIEEVLKVFYEAAGQLKIIFSQTSYKGLLLPWEEGHGVLGRKGRIKKRKS